MSSLDRLSPYARAPLPPIIEVNPGVANIARSATSAPALPSAVTTAVTPASHLTCALAVPGAPTEVSCANAQQVAERILKTFVNISQVSSPARAPQVRILGRTDKTDGTKTIVMQIDGVGKVTLHCVKDKGLRVQTSNLEVSFPSDSYSARYIDSKALNMRLEFWAQQRCAYVHLASGVCYTNVEMRTLDTAAVENRYNDELLIMLESISERYVEHLLPQKTFRTFNQTPETRLPVAQKLGIEPSLSLAHVVEKVTEKLLALEAKVCALQGL